jgi:molybdopterin-guanine dinucleotide biosynthesis protein A
MLVSDESNPSPPMIAPLSRQNIPAIILAGGRAIRMGGGDKGLLVLAGQPLLAHVIARLAPQCAPLAINANGDPARLAQFGLPVLPDTIPGHPGPLAGVLAGMDWAAALGAQSVISAAADTPFLPITLVTHLRAHVGHSGLCIAATEGGLHPTFGLWPTALRHDLRAALVGGLRKVRDWTQSHNATQAVFPSTPFDPFFNINSPEDLTMAQSHAV